MGLRLKVNLVLFAVFLARFAVAGSVSRSLLDRQAREQVLGEARLLMEAALAVRYYAVERVRPHLVGQMASEFLPQTVPAFAATETLAALRKKYPNDSYKGATFNPTNLRNRPADWEADIIHDFRSGSGRAEISGEREAPTGSVLYVAYPMHIEAAGCRQCHNTPEVAPPSMLRIYGPANGLP